MWVKSGREGREGRERTRRGGRRRKIDWDYRIGGEGGERMEREIGVNVKEEKEWRGR